MGEPTDRHGPAPPMGRGVRREVKHLSTCRKGYSVSSGERKRMMAKPCACDTRRGLRRAVLWDRVSPVPTGRPAVAENGMCQGNRVEYRAAEGEGPVPERAWSADRVSQVARASWNPA